MYKEQYTNYFLIYTNSIHYKVKEITKRYLTFFFSSFRQLNMKRVNSYVIFTPWSQYQDYRAHYIIDRQQYLTYKINNPVVSAHDNVFYNLNEETRAQRWRPKREIETLTLRRWKSGTGPCADPRSYSTPPLSRKPPPSGAGSPLLQVCFV